MSSDAYFEIFMKICSEFFGATGSEFFWWSYDQKCCLEKNDFQISETLNNSKRNNFCCNGNFKAKDFIKMFRKDRSFAHKKLKLLMLYESSDPLEMEIIRFVLYVRTPQERYLNT